MIDLNEGVCSTFVLDSYRWLLIDEYGDVIINL